MGRPNTEIDTQLRRISTTSPATTRSRTNSDHKFGDGGQTRVSTRYEVSKHTREAFTTIGQQDSTGKDPDQDPGYGEIDRGRLKATFRVPEHVRKAALLKPIKKVQPSTPHR